MIFYLLPDARPNVYRRRTRRHQNGNMGKGEGTRSGQNLFKKIKLSLSRELHEQREVRKKKIIKLKTKQNKKRFQLIGRVNAC